MSDTPWPISDAVSEPFWAGCRDGRLVLQFCPECENWQFYPRAVCASCMSSSLEWRAASGRGTVYSLTVARRAVHAVFAKRVPLVVALVDLAEGPRMLTDIVGAQAGQVHIGDAVRVAFTEVDAGVVLPMFAPLDSHQFSTTKTEASRT